MEKVLITGITGFKGCYLADYLLQNEDIQLYGISRYRSDTSNIKDIIDKISMFDCDLTDPNSVNYIIRSIKPDIIFHLAAQSLVPASWNYPNMTINTNVISTLNIFEACRRNEINPTIVSSGSSEEYGKVEENEVPITENNPLRPISPYGVSKVAQDLLGYQYYNSYKTKVIRTRAFNTIGPKQREDFVVSSFAKQIAEIEKGKRTALKVGNLTAKRDFTDVRDMIKAYWLAARKCIPGEVYNICSETTVSMREVLDTLISLSTSKIEVAIDPARMRPSDVMILYGDCQKFKKETSWKSEIPLKQTLEDTLNHWRKVL